MLTITNVNQEILTSSHLQRSVRDNVQYILNDLNIEPMWHPMNRVFRKIHLQEARNIRLRIDALNTGGNANTDDLGPEYWAVIWEVATIVLS